MHSSNVHRQPGALHLTSNQPPTDRYVSNRILFDLQTSIDSTDLLDFYQEEGRCKLLPGDMFEQVPADADCYILKRVLHDWDDEASVVRADRRCRHEFAVTSLSQERPAGSKIPAAPLMERRQNVRKPNLVFACKAQGRPFPPQSSPDFRSRPPRATFGTYPRLDRRTTSQSG